MFNRDKVEEAARPDMPALVALDVAEVRLYHHNPRKGNVEVIAESLRRNGQYRPIVVNKGTHTGRPNEVLAGNHTVIAIRDLVENDEDSERWRTVLAYVIDVDEDAAKRIVLADNRTADLGNYDTATMTDLLSSLPDLTGTGYTDEDLAKMLGKGVVEGDADTSDDDSMIAYGVVVECETEQQQVTLLERLEAEGFNVRALM